MIVQVVQQFDVGINKTKSQSPVGLNLDSIEPFAVPVQLMRSPRGALQVFGTFCDVENRQNFTQSFPMYGLNTYAAASVKEGFETFVFEADDHNV